jgi:hypothetical protein
MKNLLRDAGFHGVRGITATTMIRDVAGGGRKEFPVFLIVGRK